MHLRNIQNTNCFSNFGDFAYSLQDDEDNRYIAAFQIDKLDKDDLDILNNHELEVTNDAGKTVFRITIMTKACEEDDDDDDDSDESSSERYSCDLDDDDCRCNDKRGSSKKCCKVDCSSREKKDKDIVCCKSCPRGDRNNKKKCPFCNDKDKKCMKAEDSSDEDSDESSSERYTCDLDDDDCRCNGKRGSSKKCCKTDCNSREKKDKDIVCCKSCSSRDRNNKKKCPFCDDKEKKCMRADEDSDENSDENNSERYTCDLDDDDCRCNGKRGSSKKCCKADCSSREKKDKDIVCCKSCSSRDRNNKKKCPFCNDKEKKCMRADDSSDEDSDENSSERYTCDLDDDDCRCNDKRGSSKKCCKTDCSSREKRDKDIVCCKSCPRGDRNNKKKCPFCNDKDKKCMKADDASDEDEIGSDEIEEAEGKKNLVKYCLQHLRK